MKSSFPIEKDMYFSWFYGMQLSVLFFIFPMACMYYVQHLGTFQLHDSGREHDLHPILAYIYGIFQQLEISFHRLLTFQEAKDPEAF